MATTLSIRIDALQAEVRQQRDLIQGQKEQIGQQQSVLDIQFRRIADIQAELDLLRATVRLASRNAAASLIGRADPAAFRLLPVRGLVGPGGGCEQDGAGREGFRLGA